MTSTKRSSLVFKKHTERVVIDQFRGKSVQIMVPSLITSRYNLPPSYPPVNSIAAYAQAGNLGINMLPPPQVLAPSVMNNIQPVQQPQVAQPTYIPWPYPMPSYYPMPSMYQPPMPPQAPNPATGPLPASDSKMPADTMNTPEVLSLSQIAKGLEDKTSLANQEIAVDNLTKLIRENPDFQKLKAGAPEAIVMKALRSPEQEVRLKTLVALADEKVLSVTPRVKALLKRTKVSGSTMPVEQGLVDMIMNKNGRPTSPSYAGLSSSTGKESMSPAQSNLTGLSPELANNKEFASLLKQGGAV
mgnify:CR=1 FL=1